MGNNRLQIASVLSLDVSSRSMVFLPDAEDCASFRAEAERCHARLVPVQAGAAAGILENHPELGRAEFPDNLDLVCTIAGHLNLNLPDIIEGIRKARHDIGQLGLWRYSPDDLAHTLYLVNAFAANDPESTLQVLDKVRSMIPRAPEHVAGIFNLRADRLPRTLQWISAMREGAQTHFKKLYLVGDHTWAIRRRLPQARGLKTGSPKEITDIVCSEAMGPAIVFGFGNIKGPGRLLAEYWSTIGVPYA